MSRYSVFDNLK